MKTIKYKLTSQNLQTYNKFQWEVGKWVETSGEGELCSSGWLHCYDSPLLAVLHNPIHAHINNPRLFEVEVEGKEKRDGQLKCGYTRMRLVKEIPLPEITTEQKIKYAIYCALEVCSEESLVWWANDWLSGMDRTTKAARAAAETARAAAEAAMRAAIILETNIDLQELAERALND